MRKVLSVLFMTAGLMFLQPDESVDFDIIQQGWKETQQMMEKLPDAQREAWRTTRFEAADLYGRYENIRDFPDKLKVQGWKELKVPARDGLVLDGWFLPVEKAKGTVLVLPWHGGDAAQMVRYLRFLLKFNYQIAIFNVRYWNWRTHPQEYTGSIEKDMQDIEDFLKYIQSQPDIKTGNLAVMGCSRGGYRSILAGARFKELKAVIADCPASSAIMYDWPEEIREDVRKLILDKSGVDVLSDQYSTFRQISLIAPRPVLILQGAKDTLIPVESSEQIYKSAKFPKKFLVLENSGHCSALNTKGDSEIMMKTVLSFLNQYLK